MIEKTYRTKINQRLKNEQNTPERLLYMHLALVSVSAVSDLLYVFSEFFANVVAFLTQKYDRSRFGVQRKQYKRDAKRDAKQDRYNPRRK